MVYFGLPAPLWLDNHTDTYMFSYSAHDADNE